MEVPASCVLCAMLHPETASNCAYIVAVWNKRHRLPVPILLTLRLAHFCVVVRVLFAVGVLPPRGGFAGLAAPNIPGQSTKNNTRFTEVFRFLKYVCFKVFCFHRSHAGVDPPQP